MASKTRIILVLVAAFTYMDCDAAVWKLTVNGVFPQTINQSLQPVFKPDDEASIVMFIDTEAEMLPSFGTQTLYEVNNFEARLGDTVLEPTNATALMGVFPHDEYPRYQFFISSPDIEIAPGVTVLQLGFFIYGVTIENNSVPSFLPENAGGGMDYDYTFAEPGQILPVVDFFGTPILPAAHPIPSFNFIFSTIAAAILFVIASVRIQPNQSAQSARCACPTPDRSLFCKCFAFYSQNSSLSGAVGAGR